MALSDALHMRSARGSTSRTEHVRRSFLVQLTALAEKLTAEGVAHKLWIEQPESIPTAIALKPYPKSFVGPLLKKFSLFR